MKFLVLDNYDSFTFNLVHILRELGVGLDVYRNDQIGIDEVDQYDKILLSPGPGVPSEGGIMPELLDRYKDKKSILGVCLGHQSIAYSFGANIIRADRLLHGKTSPIYHNNEGVFKGLPNPFEATRYHSLLVEKQTLSDEFEITAWTEEDEIMGIKHKSLQIEGVQFHPESVLTKSGKELLKNFIYSTKN